jgi:hypothetical protein
MNSKAKSPATKSVVRGQPSWRLASTEVEAWVTEMGGQLGPVTFDRRGKKLQPYSVAPWAQEPVDRSMPPIIQALRGDFFCLPFGGNSTPFRGEHHPVHGETANGRWHFERLDSAAGRHCLHLSLAAKVRKGRVDKEITLIDGQNVLYCRDTVSGMSGPMNPGHHAMLKFPDEAGSGVISTSRFVYGQVFPENFEQPENRGYSALKVGAEFDSLEKVPARTGDTTDLTRYPARRGYEDLIMLVSDPDGPFAWTAVTFPKERYAWFALKDPRILRNTIFWISNGGRHYPPWNGRHVGVLGLEEVTSYFHVGLAEAARKNPLVEKGYPTCLTLNSKRPLVVPYVMAVALIPAGFDRVSAIVAAADNQSVTLRAASGKQATVPLEVEFLHAGAAATGA